MDNDLRCGQPTVHKTFAEAAAILAGDGLLTFACDIIANEAINYRPHRTALMSVPDSTAVPDSMVRWPDARPRRPT